MFPINSLFEFKLHYAANGQTLMNVFHYKITGHGSDTNAAQFTLGVLNEQKGNGNGLLVGEFSKLLGDDVTIYKLTGQIIYPTRFAVQAVDVTRAGQYAGGCTAQNVAGVITKKGALGNRHNIGALHIGGLSADAYLNGEVVGGWKNVATSVITNFLSLTMEANGGDDELEPVILNKTKVPDTDPPKFVVSGSSDIAAWQVQTTLRTMHRRTVGLGI